MKTPLWKIVGICIVIGLFLAGVVQAAASTAVQKTNTTVRSIGTQASFDPFSAGWLYRKQITIDHTKITEDLVNFPVLIHMTDQDLSTKAQPNGNDILFMAGSGTAVQLNHEIEQYVSATGELLAWVNVPIISSSTNTIFFLYYGNPTSENQQNPGKTWDANYVGVWHFKESAGSLVADSTSNGISGTASGGAVITTGVIGYARNFDGTTGLVNLGTSPLLGGMSAYTIEAWVKPSLITGETRIYDRGSYENYHPNTVLFFQDTGKLRFQTNNNDNLEKPGVLTVGVWYDLAGTFIGSGGQIALYADGVKIASTTSSEPGPTPGNIQTYIGATALSSGRKWHGVIDEVRFSKTARSGGWIAAQYANQNTPSSFMSIGPEEIIPLKKTIMVGKITNLTTVGVFTVFNAVNVRSIQFQPIKYTHLQSQEFIVVSSQYRGFITPDKVLAFCQAHI